MKKICSNCYTPISVRPCRNRPNNYCSAKCQMVFQYANGYKANTSAAHEFIRKNGLVKKRGKPAAWAIDPVKKALVSMKISKAKTGVPVPKLRKAVTKDKSYWKSTDYQAWRKAVMRRDNFTCLECGDNRGGNLEADHILPVSLFPESMLDIPNGRTLCKPCHYATPTWGAKCKQLNRADLVPAMGY